MQECRNWYADARFQDEHGEINAGGDMTVTAWFEYWLKLDIENPIIRINTAFKGCSSLEKISVLPRIYHN